MTSLPSQQTDERTAAHPGKRTTFQNLLEPLRRRRVPDPDKPNVPSVAIAIIEDSLRAQIHQALSAAPLRLAGEVAPFGTVAELAAEVERLQPDILLLGLEGLPADAGEVVRQIRNLQASTLVVAVSSSANPETILQVMRAGASEFLYPPFGEQFAASLLRAADEHPRETPRRAAGSVFGFVSAKGGCGATTVACHTAGYLRHLTGKQVLLADMDFCSGNTGYLMRAAPRYTIMDALDNLGRLDPTLWKVLVASTPEGVDMIAAPAEPMELGGRALELSKLMQFWRSQYDYIVVDLGHGLTPAVCQLGDAFDSLVLVTTDELPALRQARQFIGALPKLSTDANRLRLVINRMPRRANVAVAELERILEFPVYAAIPNQYRQLSEAYAEARLLDPGSSLGIPLSAFAVKLAGIPQEAKKTGKLAFFS